MLKRPVFNETGHRKLLIVRGEFFDRDFTEVACSEVSDRPSGSVFDRLAGCHFLEVRASSICAASSGGIGMGLNGLTLVPPVLP